MTHYVIRILKPKDWRSMRAARLKAVYQSPKEFYLPYKDEVKNSDSEWRRRCTETPNNHCAFGLFYKGSLVGCVELMLHKDPKPGECVLGRLYVDTKHQRRNKGTQLVRHALDWVANQDELHVVIAAAVKGNKASHKVLVNNGFVPLRKDGKIEIEKLIWPSTEQETTQTWYGHRLEPMRPRHKLRRHIRIRPLTVR